jgi:O-antigen ligase
MKSEKKTSGTVGCALVFGLFLGLCLWKFGNPVILDNKISPPNSASEFWHDAWPTRWANWILLPLVLVGAAIAFTKKLRWPATRWLWLLPLLWLGWQFFSATQTVDATLTASALWQFFGCVACYFLGVFMLGDERALRWLLVGVLAAFTFCLVRAVDQRLVEFPQNRQALIEGEQAGWTNYPPETILEMKRENVIITTNGVDVVNPAILAKFGKEPPVNANRFGRLFYKLFAPSPRVNGTLVYPNALAGLVLLLLPISCALAFNSAKRLRPVIRAMAIALTLFLGGAGFFWTGSKLGWLIAMALGGICLFRLKWSAQLKWSALTVVLLVGLGIFAIRFHHYFAAGATSAGARFDYWHAAGQTTLEHPLLGTGPGTFQRPYARLKSPESEMARLAHNDYLEQFSDSGVAGGIFYGAWVILALVVIGRRIWHRGSPLMVAIFIGLLGWFIQGIGEFGLYIPALAWMAFALLGGALTLSGNQIDKNSGII